ncbi:MAG: hypothetical protein V4547_04805 [Bacteroidota bacterium]
MKILRRSLRFVLPNQMHSFGQVIIVLLFLVNLLTKTNCLAQNNNVGVGTLTPAPSALLDIDASPTNNKGVLVPRMKAVQRLSIPSPANSLLVFDTDSSCFFYWNATTTNWKSLCNNGLGGSGSTGSTGSNGNTGSTGATGNVGATGTGITGINGLTGSTGSIGFTGSTGNSGTTGSIGLTGSTGSVGSTGPGTICSGSTTNYVTKFTSTTELCNSIIYDNGTNVGINTGTTPAASAALEVTSTTMGLLVPRITTMQRNAIISPAQSLLIFNITTNCYEWWDGLGSVWVSMSCGGCQIPAQPGIITGSATFCNGSAGNVYIISAVTGATSYSWTVPSGSTITAGQGTTSITVTFGSTSGNIDVTAGNTCGTSTSSSLAVVSSVGGPAAPGAITGLSPVTSGSTGIVYSISPVAGATTYTWTVPPCATITAGQGTTSITVSFASAPALIFTTSGSYTCNCITAATITVIGGGGGGGNNGYGGGGGGGYSSGTFSGLSGASLAITVGDGGLTGWGGVAGGTSSVDALISATGGGGGFQSGGNGFGGAGGIGSGGSTNRTGGNGGDSQYTYLGGGGGGAAGSTGNGSNGGPPPIFYPIGGWDGPTNYGLGGAGGGGNAGNGGRGSCFNTYPTNIAATAPTNYGGGGGGGNGNSGPSSAGAGGHVELSAVTYGGIISVTAENTCGTSTASTKIITLTP